MLSPPQDQLDLKRDIERALTVIKRLYPSNVSGEHPEFRRRYVQLWNLAVLGLAGVNAAREIARRAYESVTGELIDTEGPKVKNEHLKRLTYTGALLAAPFLMLYAFLCLAAGEQWLTSLLSKLRIIGPELATFLILWVGCFVGVILSYGSRTTKMTLEDLVKPDADYLLPITRHLFAGTMTMILGMLLALGAFEVSLAGVSSKLFLTNPMIAFLVGTFFGISELLLPGQVAKRAGNVLGLKPPLA